MGRGATHMAKENLLIFSPDYVTYLNPNRYWSMPDISTFILIGGRGIGKTTGLDYRAIQEWVKTGKEFVYVRRYKSELMKSKGILDKFITGVTTQGIGKGGFEFRYGKRRIGFGVTLAMQSTFKSGVDFSNVNLMIYDEAVLKRGGNLRYLKDEMTELFELISTVFRDRKDYRVFILGNNLDIFNPYFEYFNVPKFKDNYVDKDRGLYCELCKDKEAFMKKQMETPLYRLTKDTAYGDYHYANEVLMADSDNLGTKGKNDTLLCRLVYNQRTVSIYWHGEHELYCEMRSRAIVDAYSIVLMDNDKPNYYFIKDFRSGDLGKFIIAKYFKKEIVYESNECYTVFSEMIEEVR